jgi:hypothetical protein
LDDLDPEADAIAREVGTLAADIDSADSARVREVFRRLAS